MIICIGLSSKTNYIQWVRPFSWTPERRLLVDIREDIMKTDKFNSKSLVDAISPSLKNFKRKEFKEFSYITVDPPKWAIITTCILSLIITIGTCYWVATNEFEAGNSYRTRTNFRW